MPSLRRRRMFDDNYNIDRERRELRDMLVGPVNGDDPRLPRLQELLRREEILRERAAASVVGASARPRSPNRPTTTPRQLTPCHRSRTARKRR